MTSVERDLIGQSVLPISEGNSVRCLVSKSIHFVRDGLELLERREQVHHVMSALPGRVSPKCR